VKVKNASKVILETKNIIARKEFNPEYLKPDYVWKYTLTLKPVFGGYTVWYLKIK
jgi:hypothetical protein